MSVAAATSRTVAAPPPAAMSRLLVMERRSVGSLATVFQASAVNRCQGASSVVSAFTHDISTSPSSGITQVMPMYAPRPMLAGQRQPQVERAVGTAAAGGRRR